MNHDGLTQFLGAREDLLESRLVVTDEPPPLERPAWFPGGDELAEWARAEADPRAHGITSFELSKLDPRLLMRALRPY